MPIQPCRDSGWHNMCDKWFNVRLHDLNIKKTNMKKLTQKLSIAVVVGLLTCIEAGAVPINGSIAFGGTATATTGAATTITPSNPWAALSGTDDYAAVPFLTATMFSAISYTGTGVGATLVGGPVIPLWTFTLAGPVVYSFDLLTLTSGTTILGPLSSVALSGTGTAKIDGFDDTVGTWTLSGTGTGGALTFAFSTTTATGTAVPDGGATIMLLGAGVLALGVMRRKIAAMIS
jgi:hypothetical protein